MFATPWDLVSLRRGCGGGDDPAGNHRATPWNLVSQKSLRCLHDDSCAARSSCTSPSRRNCGVAPNRRNCGVALRALQKNLWCASCSSCASPPRRNRCVACTMTAVRLNHLAPRLLAEIAASHCEIAASHCARCKRTCVVPLVRPCASSSFYAK